MTWKRTLPCFLSACLSGTTVFAAVVYTTYLIQTGASEEVLGQALVYGLAPAGLIWFSLSLLTGWMAHRDLNRHFASH